jgi:hypothetical protein
VYIMSKSVIKGVYIYNFFPSPTHFSLPSVVPKFYPKEPAGAVHPRRKLGEWGHKNGGGNRT